MPDPLKKTPNGLSISSFAVAMRGIMPYMYVGWEILVIVLVFTAGGYFADQWLKTTPWLIVISSLLGVVVAMVVFMRVASPLFKRKP